MPDCEKQLWLVFSHLCFLNVRSRKPCMRTERGGRRETMAMDENNREGGGRNEYVKVDNAVAGQWCEARVSQAPFILSFPFPLINRTRYKGEGEHEGGCQRSSSCKSVYQPCSVNMPSAEARLPKRPPNRLILELWGEDGVQLDFEAILSVCLPPSPSLCMWVCALSVLKGLFHAADWRVLHYPSHKRTSSVVLWTS